MTAVPPPVPPEIVEKAAKAEHALVCEADTETCWQCRDEMRVVLAAVYGDIVEAARRDALTEAAGQIEALGARRKGDSSLRGLTTVEHAARIVTDLRDATAPPRAPTATVSDQGADPRTPGTPEAQIGVQSDD